ncbi:MAG: hypothetical protein AAGJ37_01515 [Pseudomonadota bacterium]
MDTTQANALPDPAQPAVLVEADRVSLEAALQALLYGRKVSVNKDAFTTANTLIIERTVAKNDRGQLMEGREPMQASIVFSLWTNGGRCWVKRNDTDATVLLAPEDKVSCKVMSMNN